MEEEVFGGLVVFGDWKGGFSGEGAIDVFFVEVVVAVFEGVDFVGGDVVVFVDVDFAFDGDFFEEVFVFVDDDVHVVVVAEVGVVHVDFQVVGVVARVWVDHVGFLRL